IHRPVFLHRSAYRSDLHSFPTRRSSDLLQKLQGDTTIFEAIETVTPGVAELRAYSGKYYSDELAATYEVRLEDDALWLVMPGQDSRARLEPLQRDVFDAGSMRLRFERSGSDVAGFLLDQGRVRGLVFERME